MSWVVFRTRRLRELLGLRREAKSSLANAVFDFYFIYFLLFLYVLNPTCPLPAV